MSSPAENPRRSESHAQIHRQRISLESELPPHPAVDFGDYTTGRYAWRLANLRPLPTPIEARGQLGLWDWTPPEGVKLP